MANEQRVNELNAKPLRTTQEDNELRTLQQTNQTTETQVRAQTQQEESTKAKQQQAPRPPDGPFGHPQHKKNRDTLEADEARLKQLESNNYRNGEEEAEFRRLKSNQPKEKIVNEVREKWRVEANALLDNLNETEWAAMTEFLRAHGFDMLTSYPNGTFGRAKGHDGYPYDTERFVPAGVNPDPADPAYVDPNRPYDSNRADSNKPYVDPNKPYVDRGDVNVRTR